MSERLIMVSNDCFYGGKIKTGYRCPPWKKFLNLESPFIFIDVPEVKKKAMRFMWPDSTGHRNERFDGTSAYNVAEIEAIKEFLKFWLPHAEKQTKYKFEPNEIAIITPYAA